MPGETTEVHYHLSANVKFDKENAFNGGETKIDGSWVNSNLEKKYFVNEKIKVKINYSNKKNYINKSKNKDTIEKLLGYDYIKINEKNIKQLIKFEDKSKNTNILISDFEDKIKDETFDFYLQSIDNKENIDKTKAGITYNIFAKNQRVNDKLIIQQFYHGGSKSGYDARKIVENKSFTLFYTREISDLNNENSLLIGLGEIQNKIGVLDTSDRIKGSKIYCYNHYDKNEDENEKYYLFRFPYQELIHIANNNVNNQKDSAKQFLEELVEPLSIENSDKPFFSKEQSKLISTYIVLKYANRLYEQIMKLKQNENLWKAVQKASKQDPQTENSEAKWHFCDDDSIRFLKLSKEKLKKAQLTQKNPGLWALKDYFQINSGTRYADFLEMCWGKKDLGTDLVLFNATMHYNLFNNFISKNLINYPIYNKKTIQRIFTHLGLKAVYAKKNAPQDISTDLSELIINGKTIQDLLNRVNEDKKIESDDNLFNKTNEGKQEEINKYLYKNGFCKIEQFDICDQAIKLDDFKNYKIKVIKDDKIKEILSLDDFNNNPYLLFEKYIQNDDAPLLLDDIDWGQKIIQNNTFEVDNKFRLRAIIVEYIKKQENQTGHVWVSYEDAQEYLNDRLFELDDKLEKFYKISDFWDIEIFEYDDKKKFLTLKEFANRETYIKKTISRLIYSSHLNQNVILEKLEETRQKDPDNKFIESELSLLKMKELDFVFISGVAGSGKSHTLCKYLDYLAENKITDFQVLTPSGKAANVIKNKIKDNKEEFPRIFNYFYRESINNNQEILKVENEETVNENEKPKKLKITRRVSTADRYIVDSEKIWNQQLFAKVDDDSVPDKNIDVLIIDEISMITLDTLYYILKIKKPKKLIILGDIKQLPPIGYGSLATSIYNHLFLESSFQDICLAKMETSHRADDNSLFIKHSLTLRDKEKQLKKEDLKKEDKSKNFILKPYSNETLEKMLEKIYSKEMLEKIYSKEMLENINSEENGSDIFKANIQALNKEIQILTPNRIGESGTYAINNIFKKALGDTKEGLKFIYNKNDKKTGLSNGTMGYYNKDEEKIDFDDIKVDYSEYNENYELGFAITVHKSQGSGFPIVILVLPEKNNSLITKELIYTALTRPEQKMYILYHKDNIKALTQLPSIPHRNMNLFDRDKLLWIKDEIEYPIKYNDIEYRRKQDLYFALMLEYSDVKGVKYHKNGSFVWTEESTEKLLMPKFYIKEKQDEKSFKYVKSIDLRKVYENFQFKLGDIESAQLPKRDKENKVDIIEDNNDSIEITTHNGLRTRSWSEAILMLIFDKLEIPYYYEVEIRREKDTNNEEINTYKLTYPNPKDKYRIPDFTISSEKNGTFPEKGTEVTEKIVEIKKVKCIIEHLGMLTNDSYKEGWKEKVADYYDVNKYNFKVIAPLSSLTKQDDKYFVSEIWEIDKDEPIKLEKNTEISIEDNICFTTDEKDLGNIPNLLENIPNLIEKIELLKEFYFLSKN
ncbi:ATP-dependent DNA helicase [Aliarcobacter cryaerophilus]|uniref:ATP-dependent DNA helicase n=1 Tax=Aliarcobacter cryaerophilus TaxID=28198 RepID=UPI003DA2503A